MSAEENRNQSPQPGPRIIVAIDGPAGAGKSTIARQLARHFGLLNLETGAMYRAFALKALRAGMPLDESSGLEALAAETSIRLEPGEEENRVLLDGEDVTGLIRNPTVTEAASRVSVFPRIRAWMVRLQQQLGAQGGVVMEGRDIGTVVFPHAEVKIFWMQRLKCAACAVTISWARRAPTPRLRPMRLSATCAPAMNAIATGPIRRSNRQRIPCFWTPQTSRSTRPSQKP